MTDDDDDGLAGAAVTATQWTDYFELPDNCTDLVGMFLDADIRWARQQVHMKIERQNATPAAKAVQRVMADVHAITMQAERRQTQQGLQKELNRNGIGR